ncbi:hypothetical protein M8J77_025106 [Diaphorina citri]|nr:hypothetical protein M8J77_025106 [Diaphorina citri]
MLVVCIHGLLPCLWTSRKLTTGRLYAPYPQLRGAPDLGPCLCFCQSLRLCSGFWSASNGLGSHPSFPQTRSEAVRETPDPPPGEAPDGGSSARWGILCKVNLRKWGYADEDGCDCGSIQTEAHLLTCPDLPETCTMEDLKVANDKAIAVTRYWMNKI